MAYRGGPAKPRKWRIVPRKLNTKTRSSKEKAEFSFKNADVTKHLLLQTEDEKQTVTFFRMCQNEAL